MGNDPSDSYHLGQRVRQGDETALRQLWLKHEDRLRRMVELRMDRRLLGRIDVSLFLRDAFAEATRRFKECPDDPKSHPILWLRKVVGGQLVALLRQDQGSMLTQPSMELSLFREALPTTSSAALAAQLLGQYTSPTQAAVRAARILRLQEAFNAMEPLDREVLTLRHFEHLSLSQTALELGIEESVAGKRYILALKQLKQILAAQ